MFESLDLSLAGFTAIFVTVFVGAFVQGSIGYGLNLIVVPVVAVVRPDVLPAAAIILALPMTLGSALRERSYIDPRAVAWTSVGRLPGVIVGAWIVSVLDPETLARVIGGLVLLAVSMSVATARFRIDRSTQAAAGLLGGLMGTASSIGGPPMALLYQHEPGPIMRSTLGATFLVGTAMSLMALGVAGEVDARHWRFAAAMLPAILLGLGVSRRFHAWLDAGWLRPMVLGFAALAGIGVLARGLLPL